MNDLAAEARALEADAAAYPEERGEILLEAAAAWRRAGQSARATELLTELVSEGGDDGCFAQTSLIEYAFEDGEDELAGERMKALAHDPALHDGHCQLVAELLAERDDLPSALDWYDRSLARLDQGTLDQLRAPGGWMQMAATMLRGRSAVRRGLGLPVDTMDELASTLAPQPGQLEALERRLLGGPPPRRSSGAPPPGQALVLVFQRGEREAARLRWPDEHDRVPDDEHYLAAERRWRELADSGVPSIRVVPATVAQLCAFAEANGGDPLDPETKASFCEAAPAATMIAWPPPRNGPCWCGSNAKYKKCCGRAGGTTTPGRER